MTLLVLRRWGEENTGWEWSPGGTLGWTFEHEQDLSVHEWVRWNREKDGLGSRMGVSNISLHENLV